MQHSPLSDVPVNVASDALLVNPVFLSNLSRNLILHYVLSPPLLLGGTEIFVDAMDLVVVWRRWQLVTEALLEAGGQLPRVYSLLLSTAAALLSLERCDGQQICLKVAVLNVSTPGNQEVALALLAV